MRTPTRRQTRRRCYIYPYGVTPPWEKAAFRAAQPRVTPATCHADLPAWGAERWLWEREHGITTATV